MQKEILLQFMEESTEDYEKFGKGKNVLEWLINALERNLKLPNKEAKIKAEEILKGIKNYRDKQKSNEKNIDQMLKNIPETYKKDILGEAEELSKAIIEDLDDSIKEKYCNG